MEGYGQTVKSNRSPDTWGPSSFTILFLTWYPLFDFNLKMIFWTKPLYLSIIKTCHLILLKFGTLFNKRQLQQWNIFTTAFSIPLCSVSINVIRQTQENDLKNVVQKNGVYFCIALQLSNNSSQTRELVIGFKRNLNLICQFGIWWKPKKSFFYVATRNTTCYNVCNSKQQIKKNTRLFLTDLLRYTKGTVY